MQISLTEEYEGTMYCIERISAWDADGDVAWSYDNFSVKREFNEQRISYIHICIPKYNRKMCGVKTASLGRDFQSEVFTWAGISEMRRQTKYDTFLKRRVW